MCYLRELVMNETKIRLPIELTFNYVYKGQSIFFVLHFIQKEENLSSPRDALPWFLIRAFIIFFCAIEEKHIFTNRLTLV